MKINKKGCLIALLVSTVFFVNGCAPLSQLKNVVDKKVSTAVVGKPKKVESISTTKYAYSCLSDEEKKVYDEVLDAMLEYDKEIVVDTKDSAVLQKAFDCVMDDYGGLFWVSGFQYETYQSGDAVVKLSFIPTYTMTESEKKSTQTQIDAVVEEWLSQIAADASDFEKSRYVYEKLINEVDYDTNSENNQNIISVFINRKTVCQGYADAVVYLLNQLGINASIVTGTANQEPHAWNIVQLDGEYYLMDVTWGNSRYLSEDTTEKKQINYAYLNTTSEELSATHVTDMPIPVPECSAVLDNYYHHEGLYFDTWAPKQMGAVFAKAKKQQKENVSIKMANSSLYEKTKKYFIDDFHIDDYVGGLNHIKYIDSADTCVLTLVYE